MPVAKSAESTSIYEILGDRGPFVALAAGRAARRYRGRARSAKRSPKPATGSSSTTGAIAAPPAWRSTASPRTTNGPRICTSCCCSSTLCRPLSAAARRVAGWRCAGAAPAGRPCAACCCGGSPAVPMRPQQLINHITPRIIEAAQQGGMAAVCAMRALGRDDQGQPGQPRAADGDGPEDFIARMERWRQSFNAGADHPVIGLSPAELRSLTMPACIVAGQRPGASAPRRPGGAPADAERRIPRGA